MCAAVSLEYLAVDPTAIRLAFVLLAFLGGSGISIYIILWIIMPVKGSEAIKEVEKSEETRAKKDRRKIHGEEVSDSVQIRGQNHSGKESACEKTGGEDSVRQKDPR